MSTKNNNKKDPSWTFHYFEPMSFTVDLVPREEASIMQYLQQQIDKRILVHFVRYTNSLDEGY